MQDKDYKISIVARGEGLTYSEEGETYHFNIFLKSNSYLLYLPKCGYGKEFQPKVLSGAEYNKIVPRIITYLENCDERHGIKHPVKIIKE